MMKIAFLTTITILSVNSAALASIVYDPIEKILYIDDVLSHVIDYSTYQDSFMYLDYNSNGNPGSHVDIVVGGSVDLARAYNNSTITMSGGTVTKHLQAIDDSTIIFSGGTVGQVVYAADNGKLSMTGGYSGTRLQVVRGGEITMSGGSLGGTFNVYGDGTIYLEGAGFEVNGTPLVNGNKLSDFGTLIENGDKDYFTGIITGSLADGSALSNSFLVFNTEYYEGTADIIIIPEPATMCLLGLGGLLLGRRKKV